MVPRDRGVLARSLIAAGVIALALIAPASASAFTATFNYTGGQQQFVVPAGVTEITIDAYGAEGGFIQGNAGLGGRATATIATTPGETLFVFVGGEGQDPDDGGMGGFNGGGNGGVQTDPFVFGKGGGGGGGASDVRRGDNALTSRVIVAGGGGGPAVQCPAGAGGGTTGSPGSSIDGNNSPCAPGGGGTQSAGGAGGGNGMSGSLGTGGAGGSGAELGGGGGGGGYYGGGGGSGRDLSGGNQGGGGGGSGLVPEGGMMQSGVRSGNGLVRITYDRASPTLATQVSSAQIAIGEMASDTATLTDGSNPTGTITFELYGPDDANCSGATLFVSTVGVNGNGSYDSDSIRPTQAGTYRWTAAYSGDPANEPATGSCNDPNETFTVSKASPTLETEAIRGPGNGQISDTATLADGFNPTGTIIFELYAPEDSSCSDSPIFTDVVDVAGNGAYTSDPADFGEGGTYRWIAAYSGDANNDAVAGACNDPGESVTITPPQNLTPPSITGEPVAGKTLSCDPGEWSDGTIVYQWRRDGSPLEGATATTYTLTPDDVGHRVDCRVTATNDDGSTSETSNSTLVSDALVGAPQGPTCAGKQITIFAELGTPTIGTNDNDVILGTPGNDEIYAGAGNDTVCLLGGDDFAQGGEGDDHLIGNVGADELRGNEGADTLEGLLGPDTLKGGRGGDTIDGGRGGDTLLGHTGNDEISGNRGKDTAQGNRGHDLIAGERSDDALRGGRGDDELDGGLGRDSCFGGEGTNSLNSCE